MQVPRDVSEDMLRPFFEPYGEIEHINILRTQRGQSAGMTTGGRLSSATCKLADSWSSYAARSRRPIVDRNGSQRALEGYLPAACRHLSKLSDRAQIRVRHLCCG